MVQKMTKPSAVIPKSPTSSNSQYPLNLPDPSMFGQNFDQLIQRRGIRFVHHRALPCPNMGSLNDNSHSPVCPHCDGSGIYYYEPKEIIGVFVSNSIEKNFEYQGTWEVGTATITFPVEYDDGTQAEFSLYDKLIITDFTVRMWEKKEYEPRPGDTQQLRYPIEKVEYMITATDTVVKEYKQDEDFTVENGLIKWISGKAPSYDSVNEIGDTYAVSYFANPVYIVLQPLRELRVSQQMIDGQKTAKRLPQHIVVRRDFFVNKPEKIAGS